MVKESPIFHKDDLLQGKTKGREGEERGRGRDEWNGRHGNGEGSERREESVNGREREEGKGNRGEWKGGK